VSDQQKILILNNLCGPLTLMGNTFKQLGFTVAFYECDVNHDLEAAKRFITEFDPGFIFQQNFNVYMSIKDFGEDMLDWIESSGIKQIFWFLARLDSIGRPALFKKWVEQGYFKNAHFFCASQAMIRFFEPRGLKTDYLPPAIEAPIDTTISTDTSQDVISYFSANPAHLHPLFGAASDTPGGIISAMGSENNMLRYFVSVIISSFPELDGNKILAVALNPIRTFFATIDVVFANHQRKREELRNGLSTLPGHVSGSILTLMDYAYTDYVSYQIYKQAEPFIKHTSGNTFWEAIDQPTLIMNNISPSCSLDTPIFQPGLVVSFSHYLSMDAPSRIPLQVMAAGQVSLSEYREELPLLVPEEYLATYKNLDELMMNIEYFSYNKPDTREQRIGAQQHVLANHTYSTRAKELIDLL
jgi:hypothetical protein